MFVHFQKHCFNIILYSALINIKKRIIPALVQWSLRSCEPAEKLPSRHRGRPPCGHAHSCLKKDYTNFSPAMILLKSIHLKVSPVSLDHLFASVAWKLNNMHLAVAFHIVARVMHKMAHSTNVKKKKRLKKLQKKQHQGVWSTNLKSLDQKGLAQLKFVMTSSTADHAFLTLQELTWFLGIMTMTQELKKYSTQIILNVFYGLTTKSQKKNSTKPLHVLESK